MAQRVDPLEETTQDVGREENIEVEDEGKVREAVLAISTSKLIMTKIATPRLIIKVIYSLRIVIIKVNSRTTTKKLNLTRGEVVARITTEATIVAAAIREEEDLTKGPAEALGAVVEIEEEARANTSTLMICD